MLDRLPVELVALVADKLQGEAHVLRPLWLMARDRAALAMSCRNGMLAMKGSQPVGPISRRRSMMLHAKGMEYGYTEAANKFLLTRKRLLATPHSIRVGMYKTYKEADLVAQATKAWPSTEAFDAERDRRIRKREAVKARAVQQKIDEAEAREMHRQNRASQIRYIANEAGYPLTEWQHEEIEEYAQEGTVDGHPVTAQEMFERLRTRRYHKETDWWQLSHALVRIRQGGAVAAACFPLHKEFRMADHICVARYIRECGPQRMLPAALAELGDWVVRHKMDTRPIELKVTF